MCSLEENRVLEENWDGLENWARGGKWEENAFPLGIFFGEEMVFWMENGCWAKMRTPVKHRCWEKSFFFFGGGGGKWDFGRKIRFWERWVCWDFFSWEHWFAWENGFSEETVLLSKIGLGDNGPLGGKVYLCRFIYIHYRGLGFGRQKGFVRIFCWGGGALGFGRKIFWERK